MFPVVPETWPRSKAEHETIGDKHFPRGLHLRTVPSQIKK